MKILISVHRYPPFIGGSEEVTSQISTGLAAEGHDVVVATGRHPQRTDGAGNPRIVDFALSGNLMWPHARGNRDAVRYRSLFQREDWDARLIFAGQTWCLGLVWDLIGRGGARDVFAPVGFSWLADRKYEKYFRWMAAILPRFSRVIYHSRTYQDYGFALARGLLNNAVVIPNGVGYEFDGLEPSLERQGLLTVGSHVRSKGHRDFIKIVRRVDERGTIVAPRPPISERPRGCYATCVASSLTQRKLDLVDGSDRVRVLEQYRTHAVFILPSSIECSPLVILEAMAAGLPWVSYEVGNASELPGGVVAASLNEAVEAAGVLLNDRDSARTMAQEGRTFIRSRTWDKILPLYTDALTGDGVETAHE